MPNPFTQLGGGAATLTCCYLSRCAGEGNKSWIGKKLLEGFLHFITPNQRAAIARRDLHIRQPTVAHVVCIVGSDGLVEQTALFADGLFFALRVVG